MSKQRLTTSTATPGVLARGSVERLSGAGALKIRVWRHRSNDNLFLVWFSSRTGGSRHDYKDPTFDKLVADAAGAPTWDQRMALYAQAERRMLEEGAAVYVYYPFGARVYKPWVQGLPKNSAGLPVQDWNIYFGLPNVIYIADAPGRPKLT